MAAALEAQLNGLLERYAQALSARYVSTTGGLVLGRRDYRENEIELLFALNLLVLTAHLYAQIIRATGDRQALEGASHIYAVQANEVERVLARTRSARAEVVARAWPGMRDDFVQLRDTPLPDGPAYR